MPKPEKKHQSLTFSAPNFPVPRVTMTAAVMVIILESEFPAAAKNPFWLVKNGILEESEISENLLVAPQALTVPTGSFSLTILKNRIQLSFADPTSPEAKEIAIRIAGGLAKKTPGIELKAIGLNFDFLISPPSEAEFGHWNRSRFKLPIPKEFEADGEPRYGWYFSCDSAGFRARFRVDPIMTGKLDFLKGLGVPSETMLCHANYHRDFTKENSAAEIQECLHSWGIAVDQVLKFTSFLL